MMRLCRVSMGNYIKWRLEQTGKWCLSFDLGADRQTGKNDSEAMNLFVPDVLFKGGVEAGKSAV